MPNRLLARYLACRVRAFDDLDIAASLPETISPTVASVGARSSIASDVR